MNVGRVDEGWRNSNFLSALFIRFVLLGAKTMGKKGYEKGWEGGGGYTKIIFLSSTTVLRFHAIIRFIELVSSFLDIIVVGLLRIVWTEKSYVSTSSVRVSETGIFFIGVLLHSL